MRTETSPDLFAPASDLATPGDAVWAAGLFEGEGTVTIAIRNQDETYRILASVSNTDTQIVDFFHTRWGGWKGRMGSLPRRRPAWQWSTSGPGAESFLRDIAPHVRTERVRRKIALALEFRLSQSRSRRAQAQPAYKATQRRLYLEMKVLNRRGIEEATSA